MFLNLLAPINNLGYGVVGYNVLKALMEEGHSVSYFPIGQPQWEGEVEFVKKANENSKLFNPRAPSIRIWHQHEMSMFPGKGPHIGWPIFELDRFNHIEQHHLESLDRVFVCSKWAKSILEKEGLGDNVHVVPLGVDPTVFHINEEARNSRSYWTKKKTVFLNVGKWEVRKGHNELLEAFCKAFKPDDQVELWMMNDNPFIGLGNEEWKARYIVSPMGQNIRILPRVASQAEMRKIFNQVDFGVFPSHSEGWGLETLELMACGVPSIVTNYAGHTEYCDETNSLLIQPTGMEKAQDGIWFGGQGEWCTFNIDELVHSMKLAHSIRQADVNGEYHGGYGALASKCIQTASKFTWKNTVEHIEGAL